MVQNEINRFHLKDIKPFHRTYKQFRTMRCNQLCGIFFTKVDFIYNVA